MKKYLSLYKLIILLAISPNLFSQDALQFSQFMFNEFQFNPAIAGSEDKIVTVADARSQWVNIPGAPQMQSLTSHMPLYKISSGIGLQITNDKAGQQRTTSFQASYAYQKKFRKTSIGIGVNAGLVQRSLDGSKLISPTGSYDDVIIDHHDDNIPISLVDDLIPDAGAGLYLYGKKFGIGLSANHLLMKDFNFETESGVSSIQYNPNLYVYGFYKFSLGKDFMLQPNILFKSDQVESMADINALISYKDNIFLGGSFRGFLNKQTDAIVLIGGWNISEKLGISYSYDITLSHLNTVSNGSHEIVLRYNILVEKPKAGKEINNLRYLYY